MGTKGVPLDIDANAISAALKRHKGIVNRACKDPEINCDDWTLRKHIKKYPGLTELLNDLRHGWIEETCDKAEKVLEDLMDHEKPDVKLKSAIYFLNNQGKERGYSHPEVQAAEASTLADIQELSKSGSLTQQDD